MEIDEEPNKESNRFKLSEGGTFQAIIPSQDILGKSSSGQIEPCDSEMESKEDEQEKKKEALRTKVKIQM